MIKLFSKVFTEKEAKETNIKFKEAIKELQYSELFTTEKIEIINNRMLLPSKPDGALVFNMALIYDEVEGNEFFDNVMVVKIDDEFYAQFRSEITGINGKYGVVSYMSQTASQVIFE